VQNFAIQKNIDSKEAEISDAIFLVLDAYAPATPRGILLFYENYVNFHPYTRWCVPPPPFPLFGEGIWIP
jgi:hypothetical protein